MIGRLAAMISLWLVVCQSGFANPVQLPQANGGTISLPHPAQRIVTLAPHLAELVYAAGLGERLIATVAYSDYPEAVKSLPQIGDAFRVDMEQLLMLQPDLIIAWESGNPAASLDHLQTLGLPVWRVEIRDMQSIAETLELLGQAAGQAEPGHEQARQIRQQIDVIKNRYLDAETVSYFYQVATQPLYTLNGEHLISQSLSLCGGKNIFADLNVIAPQVGEESVVEQNPDVIFASRYDETQDNLALWKKWAHMAAVKNQQLYHLSADRINRATPRFLDGLEQACSYLSQARNTTPVKGEQQ